MNLVASMDRLALAVALVPALPALACTAIALALALGRKPSERVVARVTVGSIALALVTTLAVTIGWLAMGGGRVDLDFGAWFAVSGHRFELGVLLDSLSISMLVLTNVITVLVARFSVRYLHREPGFIRFFMLTCVFAAGMDVLVLAGTYDLLFAGWELVGISSVLLIAFHHHRTGPARGALRAMITYRVADVGLLSAGVLLHHYAGSASLAEVFGPGTWHHATAQISTSGATIVVLALLLATIGKSALFPLGGWLPRAMEGPTPSSALFYGALSVHAGVYLLLRSAPLIEASLIGSIAIGVIGAITALHATMVGRTQSDAKSALAYATMTQVGLMLVAIGFHLWTWALIHMIAHVSLRLFQLLRAPSALRDAQEIRAALASVPLHRPGFAKHVLPDAVLVHFYHFSRKQFVLDDLLDRAVVQPVLGASRALDSIERRLVAALSGWPDIQSGGGAAAAGPSEVRPHGREAGEHAEESRS